MHYNYFHAIIIIANSSSDKVQEICQHLKNILVGTQYKLESGEITVEILLLLINKWNTHLVQMLPALSMDQKKFLSNVKFSSKKVCTFKLFVMLLKEFASSIPLGRFTLLL